MKTNQLLTIIAVTAVIGFLTPAMASARTHVSVGIGIGVPFYGGCGYYARPYPYPYYYPYYAPVYVAPPYYPPVVVSRPVVVAPPPVVVAPSATSYVNITNSNGSVTPVKIRQMGTVWVGPKGEQYLSYPTPEQLKPVYGF
jgi:hypothetical protein